MKKQIAILGSTGSIGTQALQVIEEHPDLYEVYALTANNRVDLLVEQSRKFMPEAVVIANEEKYLQLKEVHRKYRLQTRNRSSNWFRPQTPGSARWPLPRQN